jgi:hypothetical protein
VVAIVPLRRHLDLPRFARSLTYRFDCVRNEVAQNKLDLKTIHKQSRQLGFAAGLNRNPP